MPQHELTPLAWDKSLGWRPDEDVVATVDGVAGRLEVAEHLPRSLEIYLGSFVVDPETTRNIDPRAALDIGRLVAAVYIKHRQADHDFDKNRTWVRHLRMAAGEPTADIATRDGVAVTQINKAKKHIRDTVLQGEEGEVLRRVASDIVSLYHRESQPRAARPSRAGRAVRNGTVPDDDYASIDPVERRQYLREAARVPRLTPQEEVDLSVLIQAGLEAERRLTADPMLSRRVRSDLLEEVRLAREAERTFVEANRRLIDFVARRYRSAIVDYHDVYVAGEEGLREAVRHFDPYSPRYAGNLFSAFGVPYINGAIKRHLSKNVGIATVSYRFGEFIVSVRRAMNDLEDELRRMPTPAEIGERIGESNINKINEAMLASQPAVYLDAQEGEGADAARGLADRSGAMEGAIVSVEYFYDHRLLRGLGERAIEAFVRYSGVHNMVPRTYDEVAEVMSDVHKAKISRHMVRRLVAEARAQIDQNVAEDGIDRTTVWQRENAKRNKRQEKQR